MRLTVADLDCQRSGRFVFSGLSFELGGGEALALTGRNGAGKSSLLQILAGLLQPAAGRIAVDGTGDDLTLPELAHYVGHRDALKPALTPLESLAFWQAMLGEPAMTPDEALDRMSLDHAADLPCAYLSAGQRRRLALARLLVSRRPVWLLDEPTSALDAASQEVFAGLVAAHLASDGLVIAATHVPLGFEAARTLRLGEPT
ncbi:heme ABC exporter ATP-binding protein CcmA [Alsobacter sp. SYSU M60028]|uniref:Heme ABC exporter ATP-binding protein CcmA n=1 Tax=Alsobacter ponti TaxID=2962936 RepID=A0ABT1LE79_9HYPH|nr:heme ABC exporter ATP-binding protein CcmA [Alsobacter ponti]MCP8939805.1 heme ABC exporter ATP-binding protein CcmA [Alsobacter ponti]